MTIPNALIGLLEMYGFCVCKAEDRIKTTQAEGSYILVADIDDEVIVLRRQKNEAN